MFDKYYVVKNENDIIVYEAKNVDKGVQMSIYKNEELLDSTIGLLGTFKIEKDNIKLEVINKAMKSNHLLYINGDKVELTSIKLKKLRILLSENNIFNAVNPTKEKIEEKRFKSKSLLLPIGLMIFGFILQYFVRYSSNTIQLIPLIPEAIAGWILFDIVEARVDWLHHLRKGRIGFMAIVVVLLGFLGEFLFRYIDLL